MLRKFKRHASSAQMQAGKCVCGDWAGEGGISQGLPRVPQGLASRAPRLSGQASPSWQWFWRICTGSSEQQHSDLPAVDPDASSHKQPPTAPPLDHLKDFGDRRKKPYSGHQESSQTVLLSVVSSTFQHNGCLLNQSSRRLFFRKDFPLFCLLYQFIVCFHSQNCHGPVSGPVSGAKVKAARSNKEQGRGKPPECHHRCSVSQGTRSQTARRHQKTKDPHRPCSCWCSVLTGPLYPLAASTSSHHTQPGRTSD